MHLVRREDGRGTLTVSCTLRFALLLYGALPLFIRWYVNTKGMVCCVCCTPVNPRPSR